MPIVMIWGAKGGVGTSLLAADLAIELARTSRCLLVDLVPLGGALDLLLDLKPKRNWADLLPVAKELNERHIELALTVGPGGLRLLAAPKTRIENAPHTLISELLVWFDWMVLDSGCMWRRGSEILLKLADYHLIVTTLDPPSLRGCKRSIKLSQYLVNTPVDLVVNQWDDRYPIDPTALALSLHVNLAAVVPYAPDVVGKQIFFGRRLIPVNRTEFDRAIKRLARRVSTNAGKK